MKIRLGNSSFLVYRVEFADENNVLNLLIHDNCLIIYRGRILLAFLILQMCTKAKKLCAPFLFFLFCEMSLR